MKALILINLIALITGYLFRVSELNELKFRAGKFFKDENYPEALDLYLTLVNEYKLDEDAIDLKIAHTAFYTGDYDLSSKYYYKISKSRRKNIRATCLNQLGIIAFEQGKTDKALAFFKQSIIENPENAISSYNYELLKKSGDDSQAKFEKKSRESEDGTQKDQIEKANKSGIKKEGKGQNREPDSKGKMRGDPIGTGTGKNPGRQKALKNTANPGKEKELKQSVSGNQNEDQILTKRLFSEGISPEQAIQILDAMKNNEIIYFQQLQRKSDLKHDNIPEY